MSLRIRRGSTAVGGGGGNGGEPPPSGGIYGPTNGAQSVRDGAGRRSTTYTATSGAVTVNPSMTVAAINTAISNAGSSADIDWQAGTYPAGTYVYQTNQTWTGLGSGATITGAETVTPALSGGFYRITGVANLGSSSTGQGSRPVLGVTPFNPERKNQCFWDGQKLWMVGSTAQLTTVAQPYGPGTFYHDSVAGIIYLDPGLGNPSGHTVEVSVVNQGLVQPSATNTAGFTIRNFTIEKAGNGVQSDGAVDLRNNGTIIDCTVVNNHGTGVHQHPGCVISHCTLDHNGQINVHGGQTSCAAAEGIVMEYTESSHGCDAGYNWGWEGGETKWTHTVGLSVHHNWFHDSYGMAGPWIDGANVACVFEENVVEDGTGMAIDCEHVTVDEGATSSPGNGVTVRRNFASNCGHLHYTVGSSFGAGVFIDQCRGALVHNNLVQNCVAGICCVMENAGGGTSPHTYCSYLSSSTLDNYIHHNQITQTIGMAAGLTTQGAFGTPSAADYFNVTEIVYEDNVYLLDSLSSTRFKWKSAGGAVNTMMTSNTWTGQGQDDGSTFEVAP